LITHRFGSVTTSIHLITHTVTLFRCVFAFRTTLVHLLKTAI